MNPNDDEISTSCQAGRHVMRAQHEGAVITWLCRFCGERRSFDGLTRRDTDNCTNGRCAHPRLSHVMKVKRGAVTGSGCHRCGCEVFRGETDR